VQNPHKKHSSFEAKGKFRCLKCLFVRVKAFMKATTRINAFLIYALPLPYVEQRPYEIFSQYQKSKNVFEKRNAKTLPKHRPYNYTIDFTEGVQPPFRPIYNLTQDELVMICKYLDENLKKGFIRHLKFLAGTLNLFVKRKMVLCKNVSIIMD
jgi:hypothetical protein